MMETLERKQSLMDSLRYYFYQWFSAFSGSWTNKTAVGFLEDWYPQNTL
jgi:hypothetical protein